MGYENKKGEEKTNGLITFANIVLVSAAAKILRAVLVRRVGGLGRRKYNGS